MSPHSWLLTLRPSECCRYAAQIGAAQIGQVARAWTRGCAKREIVCWLKPYMPRGGSDTRVRSCRTLGRLTLYSRSSCSQRSSRAVTEAEVLACLREFYAGKPFIRVVNHLPATKDTAFTNFVDITARIVKGRILLISAEDNLIKGASGAAVQNFNVLYGHEEKTALL